jgi:hypothetical protein
LFHNEQTTIYVVYTARVGGNHFERAYNYLHDAEERVKQFEEKGYISWFVPITYSPFTNRPKSRIDERFNEKK